MGGSRQEPAGRAAKDLYVSRVEPSHHARGTGYVSVDGHEAANFKPYIFKTTDYGKTWTNISGNLPEMGPVYVVKEDLKNPNLLFAGTEFAVFYSLDGGKKWGKLNNNMPTVAVHDLMIHPRDNDLIAATHGRGLWIMDDITPLQQLSEKVTTAEAHLFENRTRDAVAAHPAARHRRHAQLPRRESDAERRRSTTTSASARDRAGAVRDRDVTGENKRTLTVPAQAGHQPARVADDVRSVAGSRRRRSRSSRRRRSRPAAGRRRWRRRRWRRSGAAAAAARRASPRLRANTASR